MFFQRCTRCTHVKNGLRDHISSPIRLVMNRLANIYYHFIKYLCHLHKKQNISNLKGIYPSATCMLHRKTQSLFTQKELSPLQD